MNNADWVFQSNKEKNTACVNECKYLRVPGKLSLLLLMYTNNKLSHLWNLYVLNYMYFILFI